MRGAPSPYRQSPKARRAWQGDTEPLAQRPGRQQTLIAQPACRIDDYQIEVMRHARILKPVIFDERAMPFRHGEP